jgi:hypothetical protein
LSCQDQAAASRWCWALLPLLPSAYCCYPPHQQQQRTHPQQHLLLGLGPYSRLHRLLLLLHRRLQRPHLTCAQLPCHHLLLRCCRQRLVQL